MPPSGNHRRTGDRDRIGNSPRWKRDQWTVDLRRLVRRMNADIEAAIVEGPNDRRGLRLAGFRQRIYTVAECEGILPFIESIEESRITILTDYDREGRKMNAKLREHLPDRRVHPIWRKEVGKLLTAHGRYDIESMNSLFTRYHWQSHDSGAGWLPRPIAREGRLHRSGIESRTDPDNRL